MRTRVRVLGANIDAVSWVEVTSRILRWARRRQSRYVCACNVHSVVTASRDVQLAGAIEGADLVTPDGMPVAWFLRRCGIRDQRRIGGPDLMIRLCELAAHSGIAIYLYGSTPETISALSKNLLSEYPNLIIAGSYSPPFRAQTEQEIADVVTTINSSEAGIVFVGLGCPKQELWMQQQREKIHAVMIGVGAAFDYHAGTLMRAPRWLQNIGLEWAFRLAVEPRRLWRRYLVTNAIFLARITMHLIRAKI